LVLAVSSNDAAFDMAPFYDRSAEGCKDGYLYLSKTPFLPVGERAIAHYSALLRLVIDFRVGRQPLTVFWQKAQTSHLL
jgi:hypothetical protein